MTSKTENPIPGSSVIGFGFNVFDNYDLNNRLERVVKNGESLGSTPWSYTSDKGDTTYLIPSNINTPVLIKEQKVTSESFFSREEFKESLQVKAKVEVSVGPFSGSVDAAYSNEQQDERIYSWAVMNGDFYAWSLDIKDKSQLDSNFESSEVYQNLPETFSVGNASSFFDFFQKFGTHYISRVYCGGWLRYYAAIEKKYNLTKDQITASFEAEYNALVASVKTTAEADWKKSGEKWTSNRKTHLELKGVDADAFNWITPSVGTYDQEGKAGDWISNVRSTPVPVNFELSKMANLFDGPKAEALEKAYAYFANKKATAEVNEKGEANIRVDGEYILPGDFGRKGNAKVAVLDRSSLEVKYKKDFPFEYQFDPEVYLEALTDDITRFTIDENNLIILVLAIPKGFKPRGSFVQLVTKIGAGSGISNWMNNAKGFAESYNNTSYAIIGYPGMQNLENAQSLDFYETGKGVSIPPKIKLEAVLLPQLLDNTVKLSPKIL